MLKLKRLSALLLALLLAFSLLACGAPAAQTPPPAQTGTAAAPTPTLAATPTPTKSLPAPTPTPEPTATPEPVDETAALLERAYRLAEGETLPGEVTLTGVIIAVDTPWSDRYQNISVVIQVGDQADKPILCFRLEGPDASTLRVGDEITVTGTLTNYRGTIELSEGCQLTAVVSTAPPQTASIHRDGRYYDPESVVLYLHTYGCLPSNFITKDEARKLGWEGGTPERFREGAAIGGDTFSNRERVLPTASGRTYTECDMYTRGESSRGSCRLVFSNDGLYFYTDDHYESFTELYVTKEGEVRWK